MTLDNEGYVGYPREKDTFLASWRLFPKLNPPLTDDELRDSIKIAFERSKLNKLGGPANEIDTPEKLVSTCLKHIRDRSDPVLSSIFFSGKTPGEVFLMDAVPHEMQRYRMKLGNFYQYLMVALLQKVARRNESFVVSATDGEREGDIRADIIPHNFSKGLRLYISVKKSSDTIGGQDKEGAIRRLESLAKSDKNVTSPYLCVFAIATPKGKLNDYRDGRKVIRDNKKRLVSHFAEDWDPSFLYPYITGRSANDVYGEARKIVSEYFPFYSLIYAREASNLLGIELTKRGILSEDGKVVENKIYGYITNTLGKVEY